MADKNQNIVFTTFDDEKVEFEVVEQTKISGVNYLLVCEAGASEEEAEAFILKEGTNEEDSNEIIYDEVVDDIELQAVAKVFAELLDDCDIQVD